MFFKRFNRLLSDGQLFITIVNIFFPPQQNYAKRDSIMRVMRIINLKLAARSAIHDGSRQTDRKQADIHTAAYAAVFWREKKLSLLSFWLCVCPIIRFSAH